MGPIRWAWPYGGATRHGPEGCGDQLPICSAMSIVASVRPSYRRRNGVYIISLMDVTRPTRSFLSSRKEGRARLHWASGLWKGGPRIFGGPGQSPTSFPLVEGRGGTSLPVGQLSRRFLLDRMLDQWLHGRKSRERSLYLFHLAFKVANHSHGGAVVNYCSWISLFRVSTLMPNGTF